MSATRAVVDTNVLVYALDPNSACRSASRSLVLRAANPNAGLCVTPQILAEFFSL